MLPGNVLGLPSATQAAAAAVAGLVGVFIDSVSGSDANDGKSVSSPKKTLGSVTLADGVIINLRCGSVFHEQIDASGFSAVTVQAYGSGALPKIDAADTIVGAWTKTAGRTNVYQIDVPHALSGSALHHVWEAGVQLTSVADLATCDSTAGSLYAAAPSGTVQTIYVHAFGSTDPITDEKVREYSRRMYGVYVGNFGTVRRIHTTRNGAEDGSLCGVNRTDILFEDCIASEGSKHNVSIGSGIVRRVTAFGCDTRTGSGTATMFVAYMDDPTGKSAVFDGCTASLDRYASWSVAYFGHGNSEPYASLVFRNCSATWFANAYAGDATLYVVTGGKTIGCNQLFDGGSATSGETYIAGHYFSNADQSFGVPGSQVLRGYSVKTTVRNCEIVSRTGADSLIWPRTANAELVVDRCTLQYPANQAGYPLGGVHVGSGSVSITNSVIGEGTHAFILAAGVSLTASNNIYSSAMWHTWNGVDYGVYAEYQAASGQDANSLVVNPLASAIGAGRISWGKGSPVLAASSRIGATEETDLLTTAKLISLGLSS